MQALIRGAVRPARVGALIVIALAAILLVPQLRRPPPAPLAATQLAAAARHAWDALLPSAPPAAAPTPPRRVPTRAVPCLPDAETVTLGVRDEAPVVCAGETCLRLLGGEAEVVDRPAPPAVPPLAATVRVAPDRSVACLDTTCKPLGPRLHAAAAREATRDQPALAATLDLAAVVVGTELWNVARDRPVTLARPVYHPNEAIRDLTVVGDLVLARWDGNCVDMPCFTGHLIGADGRERGELYTGGDVVRVAGSFVTGSGLGDLRVYDLHTGKETAALDHVANATSLSAIATLDDARFATLHVRGDGALLELFTVGPEGWLAGSVSDTVYLPRCED